MLNYVVRLSVMFFWRVRGNEEGREERREWEGRGREEEGEGERGGERERGGREGPR